MARHKINSCKQQFMAITPRRFGCAAQRALVTT